LKLIYGDTDSYKLFIIQIVVGKLKSSHDYSHDMIRDNKLNHKFAMQMFCVQFRVWNMPANTCQSFS